MKRMGIGVRTHAAKRHKYRPKRGGIAANVSPPVMEGSFVFSPGDDSFYRSRSMHSSSTWRDGRTASSGSEASDLSVIFSMSRKFGAVVFT